MARIALIHDTIGGSAGGGGGVRLLLELGVHLRERGHEVVLVCHDHAPGPEFDQLSAGLEIRAVRTGVADLALGRRARRERLRHGMAAVAALVPDDVDVVNAHDVPALRAGRLAADRLGVPLIWTRNDDIGWERALLPEMTASGGGRLPRRAVRLLTALPDRADARAAAAIVVLSEHDAMMVRRAYGREADVLRLGPARAFFARSPDRDAARAELGYGTGEFVVVAFALLMPYRRFEDLISAMARLGDLRDVRLRIVGSDHLAPAYGARLAALAAASPAAERIVVDRRSLADAELRALLHGADLFAFCSSRQSYGLAPLEALACGTPVIVSRGAGVHEVLEGRSGVSVVGPEEPGAIAAAIRRRRAYPDPLGVERTRAWIRRELTNARYAEAMEAVIARAGARRLPESSRAGSSESSPPAAPGRLAPTHSPPA